MRVTRPQVRRGCGLCTVRAECRRQSRHRARHQRSADEADLCSS